MIGNAMDLHSQMPLSRFALRGVTDPKIRQYYEDMTESMELHLKCVELLKQFFTYGEVIPFAFWSDNYNCFTDLTFLDSNFVYVKGHYLLHSDDGDDTTFYELEPDPMLINIVKSDDYVTQRLRGYLDDDFIAAVRQNKRLLLSNFSTHMIANKSKWSDLRGTSIILRCFVENTPVVLASGIMKPIQDIEPGELVLTHENKIKPVRAVFRRLPEKNEKVITVGLSGQRDNLTCSDQHEFLVWVGAQTCPCGCGNKIKAKSLINNKHFANSGCGRKWKYYHKDKKGKDPKEYIDERFEWKKLADIEPGEYLCVRQGDILAKQTTPTDMTLARARLIGYFLAEGCYVKDLSGENIKNINFTFNENETDYIADVCNILETEFGVGASVYHRKDHHVRNVRSECDVALGAWMYKYAGEYSGNKRLPDDVLLWDKKILIELCKGYLFGDGSWTDSYVTFTSKSFKLAEQVQSILWVLGVPSTTDYSDNTKKPDQAVMNRQDKYKRITVTKTHIAEMQWLDMSLGYQQINIESEFAPVVKKIFALIAEGKSQDAICAILNSLGYKTVRGGLWYRELIGRIVCQGFYGITGRRSGNRDKRVGGYWVRQLLTKKETSYDGYLYNLNVDDSHSYLVNDHVIAKNCLKSLLYSDKLRESNYSIADGNINPKWLWKLGQAGDLSTGGYMPTEDDLSAFRDLLVSANNDPMFTIITHYAVQAEAIGLNGKLLPINQEFQQVENEILTALFLNKALTTGEGPTFATASVAFRALMSRYIPIRAKLERYIYQKLFAPVAYANKFFERKQCDLAHNVRTGDGETNKLIIPTIDWRSKSNLMDDGSIKSIISSMVATGRLPMKTLTEALDLDYEEVRSYLYSEQASVFDSVAIEGRKKIAGTNSDETMIGQPFIPKQNQPVSTKARKGEGVAPAVKKAGKFSSLLSLKPMAGVLDVPELAVPEIALPEAKKDPIQSQIDKGKPERGGNSPDVDPMSKALDIVSALKAEDKDPGRTFDVMGETQNARMVASKLIERNYTQRKIAQVDALVDRPVAAVKDHEKTLIEVAAEVVRV